MRGRWVEHEQSVERNDLKSSILPFFLSVLVTYQGLLLENLSSEDGEADGKEQY